MSGVLSSDLFIFSGCPGIKPALKAKTKHNGVVYMMYGKVVIYNPFNTLKRKK